MHRWISNRVLVPAQVQAKAALAAEARGDNSLPLVFWFRGATHYRGFRLFTDRVGKFKEDRSAWTHPLPLR